MLRIYDSEAMSEQQKLTFSDPLPLATQQRFLLRSKTPTSGLTEWVGGGVSA